MINETFIGYKCINCGKEYSSDSAHFTCESCGNNLDCVYDYDKVKKLWSFDAIRNQRAAGDSSIWRFSHLLPVPTYDTKHLLPIGGTPLIELPKEFVQKIGCKKIWIKYEGSLPSGSLKDRASALAVECAPKDIPIACASTGNAAASLSALCASAGRECYIFVPSNAPRPKLIQIQIYGAHLVMVDGNYDQAFDLCAEVCRNFGWYSRNTGTNPVLSEGKKTCIIETYEQLSWQSPTKVLVSVGDGCIMGSLWKGLIDLYKSEIIPDFPQLFGVQAEGSAAISDAFRTNSDIEPVITNTYADSISVGYPRDGFKALRSARESGGGFVTVSDDEIRGAVKILASKFGIFGEPAGAAGFAGLLKMASEKGIDPEDEIVVIMTGSGLKDIKGAESAVGDLPEPIAPDLQTVREFLKK